MGKFVVLVIIVAAGIGGYMMFQDFAGFDPEQQCKDFRAKITPGIAWNKVADMHEPNKFAVLELDDDGILQVRSSIKFSRSNLRGRINDGSLPDGFQYTYDFGNKCRFSVGFDTNGNMIFVHDEVTMKSLLQLDDE